MKILLCNLFLLLLMSCFSIIHAEFGSQELEPPQEEEVKRKCNQATVVEGFQNSICFKNIPRKKWFKNERKSGRQFYDKIGGRNGWKCGRKADRKCEKNQGKLLEKNFKKRWKVVEKKKTGIRFIAKIKMY